MTQTSERNLQRIDAEDVRQQLAGKHVCPFCGVIRADAQQPCPRCTMEDNGSTRSATRQRIGPWFVLQARNPSAPGMRFATLLSLVKKGHVTPRSIVRGPTTHQLWTFAARVRGLSREFGLCFHCGEQIEQAAALCRVCGKSQEPPADPDLLLETNEASAPELPVSAAVSSDTGMDGGTSLDLQADSMFAETFRPPAAPMSGGRLAITPLPEPLDIAPAPTPPVPATPPAPVSRPTARQIVPAPRPAERPVLSATDESILTAKELAAAFQLDFKPPPGAKATAPRRMGAFKTFCVLVLILAIATAIVMFVRPDMRAKSVAWLNDTWASIKSSLETPATSSKPTPSAGTPVTAKPGQGTWKPLPKPDYSKEDVALSDPEPAQPVPPEPKQALPTPAPVAPAPQEVPPPPAVVTPPAVVEPPRVEAPAPEPVNPEMPLREAIALGSQLRNQALDAEAQRDWGQAVSLYERILQLPAEARPADVQMRLDRARRLQKQ